MMQIHICPFHSPVHWGTFHYLSKHSASQEVEENRRLLCDWILSYRYLKASLNLPLDFRCRHYFVALCIVGRPPPPPTSRALPNKPRNGRKYRGGLNIVPTKKCVANDGWGTLGRIGRCGLEPIKIGSIQGISGPVKMGGGGRIVGRTPDDANGDSLVGQREKSSHRSIVRK